ncbi:Isochorismatase domain-containing protein 2 [Nymphon striatum]|nr:Isochorismatase domain-containing protein 2 [Nymphon striatum]
MASFVRNVCNVGKIAYKNTAVFLCDMQEKFRGNIQYFPQIIAVSSRILKAGKILDMPIIATEQYPKGLGPTVAELELQKNNIQAFPKTQFSMMTNDVQDLIKKSSNDIKSVVLCGIETHVCIQGTALSLLEEGYDVHIVVDGCSSRSMVDR